MLDGGSSQAHARAFLDALEGMSGARPSAVVYTHSDWDHVFGGAEVGGLVMAHESTAPRLRELAATDWSDAALDERVAAGAASAAHAAHVKEELPSPRTVVVAQADVIFGGRLDIDLGGVVVRVRHVGGDHSSESCVMGVAPDGVLFLGDCLYASPAGGLTAEGSARVREGVRAFDASLFVDGHDTSVASRAEMESLLEKVESAETIAATGSSFDERDEDLAYYVAAFQAGDANTRS
jgi:glyoxylase-like metal-dependent hydrolase (beta-lactamase superfamily II)